jgi:tRNA U34 5-methylaminomethyl-2-thiouridine-forming methyltransferase MnmC
MTWIPQQTEDGSFTFFSNQFGEAFHSQQGARSEAFLKFVKATHLVERATQPSIRLLDVCYGLGYNTAAALETIWQVNPVCQVELYGLELDETVPRAAIDLPSMANWSLPVETALKALAIEHQHQTVHLKATLWIGDARQTVQKLQQTGFQADAIFFDPFSPRRCPQLWTVEFLQQIANCLAPTGYLATYSRSASVRSAMQAAGLQLGTIPVETTRASHEWSQGTVAAWTGQDLHPLSLMEQEHLRTRAAVPYRDPQLQDTAEVILQRHQQEQALCPHESTSSWRRRWGID